MRTGDTVRDGQGNAYQVGQLLGRGLWGKSFLARRETNDALFVLKVPLSPDDLRSESGAPDTFFAACREALMEEARLYEQGQLAFLPRLESRFTTPDGQPALLLPRFGDSLERRILDGLAIGTLVEQLLVVAKHARTLASGSITGAPVHGGLRPSNILFTERGDVFVPDPATPAVRKNIGAMVSHLPGGNPYLPPEVAVSTSTDGAWPGSVDTWAIAMILWRGIMGPDAPIVFPVRGLDKAQSVAVKDKLVERMKGEDSNPRFHGRLAERVGVLLSRALSLETSPSPPYRFTRLDEMVQRLEEVAALVRPHVTNVGKVLHDRPAAKSWFDTTESVAFSVTVGASTGVEGREEIGVGIAVFDIGKDERIKDLELNYTVDKHPSGRYRFAFGIAGLPPGNYRTRVAFAIRDSGQPPATAETEFEVRAAPGWVPPAPEPQPGEPLAFARENTGLTQPRMETSPPPPSLDAPNDTLVPATRTAIRPPTPPLSIPGPPTQPRPLVPESPTGSSLRASRPPEPDLPPPSRPRPILPAGVEEPPAMPVVALPAPKAGPSAAPIGAPAPAPIATPAAAPVPPTPAAMGGPAAAEEPSFQAPKNWTYEPIPKKKGAEPSSDDPPSQAEVDLDDDGEPGLIERSLAALKNDPYVLVMFSLGAIIVILLVVFLLIRS